MWPSDQVRERVMCGMHYDLGSKRFKCEPQGWSSTCRPGCPTQYCENGVWWECGARPENLKEMMLLHDAEGIGHVANDKYNGYNEVVLDSWKFPWEEQLAQIVMATFIQAGASADAKSYAKLAHDSLIQQLNATGDLIDVPPMVEYDPLASKTPFTLVDDSAITPMRCKEDAAECWRRKCDAQLFRRSQPPRPPPPPPASPLVIVDEEVSYEDLIKAQQVKQLVKEGKMGEDSCAEK